MPDTCMTLLIHVWHDSMYDITHSRVARLVRLGLASWNDAP